MPFGHNDSVDGIADTISGLRVSQDDKPGASKYVPPHLRRSAPEPTNWADAAESEDSSYGGRDGGRDSMRSSGGWGGRDSRDNWGSGDRGGGRSGGGGGGWDRRASTDYGRDNRDSRGPPPSYRGGRGGSERGGGGGGGFDRWSNWRDSRLDPNAHREHFDDTPQGEDAELFTNQNTGIKFDDFTDEDIPVETSGEDCPPPIGTFDAIDLGDVINRNIKLAKYSKPTPVQRNSIPIVMKGMCTKFFRFDN